MPDYADKKAKKDILVRLKDCYKKAVEADQDNRRDAMEDIKFARLPTYQWDETTKKDRGKDRLMLEFNKAKVQCKRVINEMRANRPAGKIRGTEDNDKDTAEVLEGLARNIWNVSDGDSISDYQAEYQVFGGYGVWEIVTDYSSDTAFDQDIFVRNIANPFCVWSDPASKDMLKRDAMWWIKEDKMRKETYKQKYPKAEIVSFDSSEFDDDEEWEDDDSVRICEYWWKEPTTKTIALLTDGKSVDMDKEKIDPAMIVTDAAGNPRIRKVKCHKIMMAICSGEAVLEGPTEWVGSKFPFVPVYGDYLLIDGQIHWSGMVRDLKDPQRAYNDARTSIIETINLAPQAKVWATATQANGLTKQWSESHKKNFPWMLYNSDPAAPGPPQRVGGADVPVALIQAAQIASEEINSIAGFMFDPNAQTNSNSSGKALNARARQGQLATFNYPDNMGKAMKLTWEILIDLIPKIYDTERSVRILGADGAEKFMKVNQRSPTGEIVHDLSRGKFDVTVTVGPSFATQRQEAVEAYTEIGAANPQLWGVAGDLMFKAMDLPLSDQMAERFKHILPPPIQKMIEQGKEMPPEVVQAMAQVDQMQQMVTEQGKLVEAAAQEAEQVKTEAIQAQSGVEKAKSEVQIALANLKTEEANFKTMQAQFEAQVAQAKAELQTLAAGLQSKEAGLLSKEMEVNHGEQQSAMISDAAQAAIEQIARAGELIAQQADDFLGQAAQVVMDVRKGPDPRPVSVKMRTIDGKKVGEVTYEDGSVKQIAAERINGEMVGAIIGPEGPEKTVKVSRTPTGEIIGSLQ